MKRTRRVLRGRRLWPFLDTLMNYERNPNHSINEHVDHVVNMIKRLEVEYIFQSNHKKKILQMSLTELEDEVLENIWEFIQEGPHGLTNRSFDDLVALFKEHWKICFVKNDIRQKQCFLFLITCEMQVFQILLGIKILEGYGY